MDAKAIVMRAYGPPDVLRLETVGLPPLAAGEIRIRSIASAVNYSDLQIRAGRWPVRKADPFPYVPGLEVVGDVIELGAAVEGVRVGDRVITMMQGLGGVRAERAGGYAEYVTVAASAAAVIPRDLDPHDMAALGLAAVTAFEGLRRLGPIQGRRVVVTGATGRVGSAAIGVARALGAGVIAVVRRAGAAECVRALGADEVIATSEGPLGARLGTETVDGVLDTVAGDDFAPCVAALRPAGRLVLVGAAGGGQVAFDAWHLLLGIALTGYSSEDLDGAALRTAIAAIAGWLRHRALVPPPRTLLPLQQAAEAHARLERRSVDGRILLVPPGC